MSNALPPEPAEPSGGDYGAASVAAVPAAVYFRELMIDFLATLLPGLWFVAATVPAILLPVFWLITLSNGDSSPHFFETI